MWGFLQSNRLFLLLTIANFGVPGHARSLSAKLQMVFPLSTVVLDLLSKQHACPWDEVEAGHETQLRYRSDKDILNKG